MMVSGKPMVLKPVMEGIGVFITCRLCRERTCSLNLTTTVHVYVHVVTKAGWYNIRTRSFAPAPNIDVHNLRL